MAWVGPHGLSYRYAESVSLCRPPAHRKSCRAGPEFSHPCRHDCWERPFETSAYVLRKPRFNAWLGSAQRSTACLYVTSAHTSTRITLRRRTRRISHPVLPPVSNFKRESPSAARKCRFGPARVISIGVGCRSIRLQSVAQHHSALWSSKGWIGRSIHLCVPPHPGAERSALVSS